MNQSANVSQQSKPREITIKIPRLPKDSVVIMAGIIGFLIAFIFGSFVLKELNELKQQQKTSEERIKKEVLMPGGTTEYKTEFKPDPSRDTAKDLVTEPVDSRPTSAVENVTPTPVIKDSRPQSVPAPPPPTRLGPGNFDGGYTPSYSGNRTGPGNM